MGGCLGTAEVGMLLYCKIILLIFLYYYKVPSIGCSLAGPFWVEVFSGVWEVGMIKKTNWGTLNGYHFLNSPPKLFFSIATWNNKAHCASSCVLTSVTIQLLPPATAGNGWQLVLLLSPRWLLSWHFPLMWWRPSGRLSWETWRHSKVRGRKFPKEEGHSRRHCQQLVTPLSL